MIFKYGKVYRHTSGDVLRIVGVADTHYHGKCLIGEDQHGNLKPIGQEEANAVNYVEITGMVGCCPHCGEIICESNVLTDNSSHPKTYLCPKCSSVIYEASLGNN